MSDDDGWIFYGHGSTHEMRDAGYKPDRLDGLRSVKTTNIRVERRQPQPEPQRMGFHRPRQG